MGLHLEKAETEEMVIFWGESKTRQLKTSSDPRWQHELPELTSSNRHTESTATHRANPSERNPETRRATPTH